MITFSRICLLAVLILPAISRAEVGCQDAQILSAKMITDTCWDCIFPIMLAGKAIVTKGNPVPSGAVTTPLCSCVDDLGVPRPGVTNSMWEPSFLIEFQRVPGCSSVLGGIMLPANRLQQGNHRIGSDSRAIQKTFMHYHMYSYPLLAILNMFTNGSCQPDGYMDLDLMYISELDPTWNTDELAFFTNPEAAAVANPVAAAACAADAAAAATGHPIKSMFWCAGSWGTIYPLSGNQYATSSLVKNTSLLKVKVLAGLHRRGLARRTAGADAMCEAKIDLTFPKDMYKYTLTYPLPETSKGHVTGETTFKWGELNRTIPAVGEDLIYTVWRWRDCCAVKGAN
ncbi:MAG: conjugal transfer protein TraU [Gammaproteobacteria bacterium]|nr:MAG: conjugal transfer protein TraU [Gammaproteobacteria bacterium]